MTGETIPLTFACGPAQLVGLLHPAAQHLPRGVVIVVGAPQYRVGSHRQFVLLARELAGAGFPVLRFDYRGMGDSDGEFAGFEGIDDDIRSAVNIFFDRVPGLRDVVLWGLCDGASAAAFYGANDPRVSGLVIVNPWVRTEQTAARARLSGYYIQRLASRAFWARALGGKTGRYEFTPRLGRRPGCRHRRWTARTGKGRGRAEPGRHTGKRRRGRLAGACWRRPASVQETDPGNPERRRPDCAGVSRGLGKGAAYAILGKTARRSNQDPGRCQPYLRHGSLARTGSCMVHGVVEKLLTDGR